MVSKFFTLFILVTFELNSLCVNIQNADYWISHLNMIPHPEGGYYKEVFRSRIEVLKKGSSDEKQALSSIYYLLQGTDYSGFHRLASDEIWYYHQGESLFIYELTAMGLLKTLELSDRETGDLSVVIEAGSWFAAGIPSGMGFSLVSCAVAPAFYFSDFEIAKRNKLKQLFPQYARIVERFCRLTD
jgi:hypothetical protein